jgi:hypothetical protein
MIEVIAKCRECNRVARYATLGRECAEPGEVFLLPAPHRGCGSLRGEMIMQTSLAGIIQPLETVLWPDFLPG